ncbi:DNA methyltransferase [Salmonella enterica]
MATKAGDLVLDFHLGSGTTATVAHKMGRRYIGIEQMDYIKEITVPRLQKVIDGEQGGISRAVNWQGGQLCLCRTDGA